MGRIVLLRHGKAQAHGEAPDLSRRLTALGEAQATAIGRRLRSHGLAPDVVVTSPAARALRTAQLAAAAATEPGGAARIVEEADLYEAEATDVWAVARRHPAATLWVVGHNPALEDAAGTRLGVACAAVLDGDGLRLLEVLEP
ncbi:MAG: phosphohistidine phosphatase [Thermoplasmata archaeon]|jgi:phosphohistidine phosphatase|nr:phosphohistidine phosphatase [Thermoplasmata archaeon]